MSPVQKGRLGSLILGIIVFFCIGRYLPQFLFDHASVRLVGAPTNLPQDQPSSPPAAAAHPPASIPIHAGSAQSSSTEQVLLESPPAEQPGNKFRKNPWKLSKAREYEKFSFMPHGQWNADAMWSHLIKDHQTPETSIVVEIGSYDCSQCLWAAQTKPWKKVYCFEPSPTNHARCLKHLEQAKESSPDAVARIELSQLAMGAQPDGELEFHGAGGTGDHAGSLNEGEIDAYRNTKFDMIVKSTNLDTFLKDNADDIFMVKIDTQGFDGFVLQGMNELLTNQRIQYVIIEFWPIAMKRAGQPCRETLEYISQFKYRAYEGVLMALNYMSPIDINDPIPGGKGESYKQNWERKKKDIDSVCKWYEARPEGGPHNTFGMWSDVLLVRQ
ncbi:hypothetical protein M427DRAFT_132751 [Gonapodya prolifera JEL478]|uniref:Methyltransferase FkbM domain-containing protein n=1 Tax=Gonapodya prolifera (strain JEL478) TaxID=1344416 RepID=A0A139AP21_GONPJ|nr:hypothetical protein M427DRAFT_132751 [Gonapodya prolifera JEL478]|eukprot:KXS18394.1 hypothetical protein M427DRAFT_132751 [Gonapodya prolifera JEL478]